MSKNAIYLLNFTIYIDGQYGIIFWKNLKELFAPF